MPIGADGRNPSPGLAYGLLCSVSHADVADKNTAEWPRRVWGQPETFGTQNRLYACSDRTRQSEQIKQENSGRKGEKNMNQTDINKYKAILEAKQTELSAGLRNREDIAIEKTPDAIDEVQLAGERELAIRNLDRESNLLRNVKGALARIADGSYGVCLHCDEDIKPKRLDAVPWTKYCIRCQEAADRHEFEADGGDSADELLANAA